MKTSTGQEILAIKMDPKTNDAKASSIQGYLVALLARLWRDREGFGGKRPFGSGYWYLELHAALIHAGVLRGFIDEDGCVEDSDDANATVLIARAIAALNGSIPARPAVDQVVQALVKTQWLLPRHEDDARRDAVGELERKANG